MAREGFKNDKSVFASKIGVCARGLYIYNLCVTMSCLIFTFNKGSQGGEACVCVSLASSPARAARARSR